MSYLLTATSIEAAAIAVNPNGRFIEGRHVDITIEASGSYPVITLYPFGTTRPASPNFIGTNTLLVGFWEEDKLGNNLKQRREIISRMDILCNAFLNELEKNKFVRVENAVCEPQYLQYGGTLSGYAARFNYL